MGRQRLANEGNQFSIEPPDQDSVSIGCIYSNCYIT